MSQLQCRSGGRRDGRHPVCAAAGSLSPSALSLPVSAASPTTARVDGWDGSCTTPASGRCSDRWRWRWPTRPADAAGPSAPLRSLRPEAQQAWPRSAQLRRRPRSWLGRARRSAPRSRRGQLRRGRGVPRAGPQRRTVVPPRQPLAVTRSLAPAVGRRGRPSSSGSAQRAARAPSDLLDHLAPAETDDIEGACALSYRMPCQRRVQQLHGLLRHHHESGRSGCIASGCGEHGPSVRYGNRGGEPGHREGDDADQCPHRSLRHGCADPQAHRGHDRSRYQVDHQTRQRERPQDHCRQAGPDRIAQQLSARLPGPDLALAQPDDVQVEQVTSEPHPNLLALVGGQAPQAASESSTLDQRGVGIFVSAQRDLGCQVERAPLLDVFEVGCHIA